MSQAVTHTDPLSADNLTLRPGSTFGPAMLLILLGVVGMLATLGFGFAGGEGEVPSGKIALSAYQTGAIAALGMMLGSLVFVMIIHQTSTGWAALVRRQAENVMSLMPLGCLLVAVALVLSLIASPEISLYNWMDTAHVSGDPVYQHKAVYLNMIFWSVRSAAYMLVWIWLARGLVRWSREQDRTGDGSLTTKMRRRSSYGIVIFAFTTAFASFDWMMALDYHWFSTMFGVYFFAQNMGAGLAATILVMVWIRRSGRAMELTTQEHLHDMGKLLFGFTAFWGYIAFSQYFLIWYTNIPEETAWFIRRKTGDWQFWAMLLPICRFVVPFVMLMPRPNRRSPVILSIMSVWVLAFTIYDLLFVIRGEVYGADGAALTLGPVDAIAAVAPMLLVFGVLLLRIVKHPLAPPHDPRIDEALHHKNYF